MAISLSQTKERLDSSLESTPSFLRSLSCRSNNFNTIGCTPLKTKMAGLLYASMRNLVQFVQIRKITNRFGGFAKDELSPCKYWGYKREA